MIRKADFGGAQLIRPIIRRFSHSRTVPSLGKGFWRRALFLWRRLPLRRYLEAELATLSELGLDPDPSVVTADDLPYDGQSQALSIGFGRIQPVEELENLLLMFGGDTDPIVFHTVDAVSQVDRAGYPDFPRSFRVEVLDGVSD